MMRRFCGLSSSRMSRWSSGTLKLAIIYIHRMKPMLNEGVFPFFPSFLVDELQNELIAA